MKNQNALRGVVGVAFGILLWIVLFQNKKRNQQLKQNFGMATGHIYRTTLSKGARTFFYVFSVGNKEYQGGDVLGGLSNNQAILDKYFPVVYDTTDVSINNILVRPKDFKRFEIPFPDSLEWVKQYIEP